MSKITAKEATKEFAAVSPSRPVRFAVECSAAEARAICDAMTGDDDAPRITVNNEDITKPPKWAANLSGNAFKWGLFQYAQKLGKDPNDSAVKEDFLAFQKLNTALCEVYKLLGRFDTTALTLITSKE